MNHKLLTKFVFSGMQKNKKTLIPYLLAGTMTVMIYYILQSLAHCPYIYKDGVEAFWCIDYFDFTGNQRSDRSSLCGSFSFLYKSVYDKGEKKGDGALWSSWNVQKEYYLYFSCREPDECFDQHCHRNCDGDFSEQINAPHSL